ncbi:hypothetical protein GMORB2_6314 [Geosmithia morbida]|uniref:Uncharacterized protein n=1 Tax=Geosmithia morbida TaxID=1094350 RepID=A0A9P4YXQ6_9HYPO|nr:uncharacterized protein GMORB2_6314 [Geosmithia morbida]KAF4123613.1 hypothetical protein GMORB2_6314 [Geosmithia morbida]
MDDLRFRSQRSPRDESNNPTTMSLVTPPRNGSRMPQPPTPQQQQHFPQHASAAPSNTADSRSNLPRRFTTDSGRIPTLSTASLISPPPRGPDPAHEYNNGRTPTLILLAQIEKKKLEYERIREQRRRFELEMQKLDQDFRREARELAQMEEDVRIHGHQSEPTTPPEHHNSGFPSIFSRPSRYSMSSLASPPGFQNRPARSGSQLISPPSGVGQGRYGWDDVLPSRSVPLTRRNSDDEDKDESFRTEPVGHHRSTHR